jgi:hypothetical protein
MSMDVTENNALACEHTRQSHCKQEESVTEVEDYTYVVSSYYLQDGAPAIGEHVGKLVHEQMIRTIARRCE